MFRPMLSATLDSVDQIHQFPMLASPKLDGIRATVMGGSLVSRNGKPIPNVFIRTCLERPEFEGLDGELIVGLPHGEDTFLRSTSGVMSRGGEPEFCFWVFDKFTVETYEFRYMDVERIMGAYHDHDYIDLLPHLWVNSKEDVDKFEAACLARGYEGIMLRSPRKPYKMGRSTLNEQGLMKLKRFKDSEATVVGVEERMHNANEATIDTQGYIERSKHKENMIGRGDLGALLVKDCRTGVEFSIGSGFDDAQRRSLWLAPPIGRIITYKYFPLGSYDKPRFPVFKGFREDL